MAADEEQSDVVQLLLSAGANMEAVDTVKLMIHYCMTAWFVLNTNILSIWNQKFKQNDEPFRIATDWCLFNTTLG